MKLGEIQSLTRMANFYTLFYLLNTITRSFEVRSGELKIPSNRKWKDLQKKIYSLIESTSIAYYKHKVLLNLPRFFNEEVKQLYCTKEIANNKPSNFFLRLTLIIENVHANLQQILLKNIKDFQTNRFLQFIFYILEYHLYLDYHNNGKNEFKFIIDKDLIRILDIKLQDLSFYVSRSIVKLGQITKQGMERFIFDITFICFFVNYLIKDPKFFVNSEEFLARIIHVYCKEIKSLTPNDFVIKKELFVEKIRKYLADEFQVDKISLKQKLEEQKKTNITGQNNILFL